MARLTISALQELHAGNIGRLEAQQLELSTMRYQLEQYNGLKSKYDSMVTDLSVARTKIAELEKVFSSEKSSKDYYLSEKNKAENELEQAHAVLDGVDGAPTRVYESNDSGYKRDINRNVVTRLAGAFLAIARNGGVK